MASRRAAAIRQATGMPSTPITPPPSDQHTEHANPGATSAAGKRKPPTPVCGPVGPTAPVVFLLPRTPAAAKAAPRATWIAPPTGQVPSHALKELAAKEPDEDTVMIDDVQFVSFSEPQGAAASVAMPALVPVELTMLSPVSPVLPPVAPVLPLVPPPTPGQQPRPFKKSRPASTHAVRPNKKGAQQRAKTAATVGTWVTGRCAKDRRQIYHAASLPALLETLSLEPEMCGVSDIRNGQCFYAGEYLITEYMPPPADQKTCTERLNTLIVYRIDDPAVWLGFQSAAHAAAAIGVETAEVTSVLRRTSPHVQGWGVRQKIVAMRDPIFGDGKPAHIREHRPPLSSESLQAVSPTAGVSAAAPSVRAAPGKGKGKIVWKGQQRPQPTNPSSDRKTTSSSMSTRITVKGLSTRPVLLVHALTNERQFFISGNAAAAFLGVRPAAVSIARKKHGCVGTWQLSDPQSADYPSSYGHVLLSPGSGSGTQRSPDAVRFAGILDGKTMAPAGQSPGIVDGGGSTTSVGAVKSGPGSGGPGSARGNVSRKRRRIPLGTAAGKKNKPKSKDSLGGTGKYAQKEVVLTPVYSNAGIPTHPGQRFSTIKAAGGFLGLRPDTITAAVKDQRTVKGYRITYLINNVPCKYHHKQLQPLVVDHKGTDGAGSDSVQDTAAGTLSTSNELVISLQGPSPMAADSESDPKPGPGWQGGPEPGHAMVTSVASVPAFCRWSAAISYDVDTGLEARPIAAAAPTRSTEGCTAKREPEPEPVPSEPMPELVPAAPETWTEPGHAMTLHKAEREPEPMPPELGHAMQTFQTLRI